MTGFVLAGIEVVKSGQPPHCKPLVGIGNCASERLLVLDHVVAQEAVSEFQELGPVMKFPGQLAQLARQQFGLLRGKGHGGGVTALALLPDGRLASGSNDRTIRLWDLATGAEVARLEGHGGGVTALALLPDGRLASGSDDRTIRLWALAIGAEVARLEATAME